MVTWASQTMSKCCSGSVTVVRRWRGLALLLLTLVAACWPTPSAATPAVIAQPPVELPLSRQAGVVPLCAKDGDTYCEKTDDYPSHLIAAILEKKKDLLFFGNDSLPVPIAQRATAETTLCRSVTRVIFPRVGRTTNAQWKFIVNDKPPLVQGIVVEECTRPANQACALKSHLPLGVVATCKQKYTHRRLLSLETSGEVSPKTFVMPACCACTLDHNLHSRALLEGLVDKSKRR